MIIYIKNDMEKKTKDKREKQNKTKVEINVGDTSEFRL